MAGVRGEADGKLVINHPPTQAVMLALKPLDQNFVAQDGLSINNGENTPVSSSFLSSKILMLAICKNMAQRAVEGGTAQVSCQQFPFVPAIIRERRLATQKED